MQWRGHTLQAGTGEQVRFMAGTVVRLVALATQLDEPAGRPMRDAVKYSLAGPLPTVVGLRWWSRRPTARACWRYVTHFKHGWRI